MTHPLETYLNLPWSYRLEWWQDDDASQGYYVATIDELPGCMSDGETTEQALTNLKEALELHLESMLDAKIAIPEPMQPSHYKGQIAYRTTPTKHYQMTLKAKQRGISLNQLIDEAVEKHLKTG
ncbi:MAG: type II toxin-antitoxin system HicB family antitoxin [Vampirovibrionales bacterium]|nr:type II toxin-antitoxin system HicB family antitoxin [Vampirovibrionales bacterium]